MDSCLFFCHSQTSKNLDFRVKEPHLSQLKRRNNGGFRLDWSRNRSLLPKRGATSYFANVLKSGGLCLKTVSPARIAGRCERRWSHRFIQHFFRPPGSRRYKPKSLVSPQAAKLIPCVAYPLRPLAVGSGDGFAKRRAHGLHTLFQRLRWDTDATPPSKGRHGAAQGQQRGNRKPPTPYGAGGGHEATFIRTAARRFGVRSLGRHRPVLP